MKRICKATRKKGIKRGNKLVQDLYEQIRYGGKPDDLDRAHIAIDKLPILNNKPILVRNRKGVMIEIVGKKGSSRKYGVDRCGGVYYFDGNRLGKRKLAMVKAFFSVNTGREIDSSQHDAMQKVWHKVSKQARL